MSDAAVILCGGPIFDGTRVLEGHAVLFQDGMLAAIAPAEDLSGGAEEIDLAGDILSPGYVDLQVNGGGGVMFNNDPSVDALKRIVDAHRRLGVVRLLLTLITDTPEVTTAAIDAVTTAVQSGVPGIAGLHLEGPHLSVARKGAHDAALIRRMDAEDLERLLNAARVLPVLKVTVAPESVTEAQVKTLASAGILVSLGHTDADYETCRRYFAAGAQCATHLFNAMSQLGNREPGLVGAALADPEASAGLIADGVHVHPEVMRMAWASKRAPGRLFLVSDAMAVAGTDDTSFELNGRTILRKDGRLTLADGTLAGADLDLTTAVSVLVNDVGVALDQALATATSVPANIAGMGAGTLNPGETRLADVIRIKADFSGVATVTEGS